MRQCPHDTMGGDNRGVFSPKSDVDSKFVRFRTFIHNHFQSDIKVFQCDNGGEYANSRFQNLYNSNDIQMCFFCPHTSQQNGKSERMLRTINNIVLTLLFHAHLTPDRWVEALHMATRLLNILPFATINHDTPFSQTIPH